LTLAYQITGRNERSLSSPLQTRKSNKYYNYNYNDYEMAVE